MAKRLRKLNSSGFSLLEILLASIIFIISVAGVFVTLTAVRKPVIDKENSLTAAVFGRQVLEALRSSVNATNYYDPCAANPSTDFTLCVGPHVTPLPSGLIWPLNFSTYNTAINYTVSCADGTLTGCVPPGGNPDMARRVDLTINWPEAP